MSTQGINNKVNFEGLDLFKFFIAFLVVAIHVIPKSDSPDLLNSLFQTILNTAVPFFFMTTGYLLEMKIERSTQNNKNTYLLFLINSLKLYVIWSILYLPLTIYGLITNDEFNIKGILYAFKNFLFKGENYFSWPLWYLLTMVYFGFILILSDKFKVKLLYMFFIIYFLYVALLVNITYFSHIEIFHKLNHYINTTFGGLRMLFGFIIILLGMQIRKNKIYFSPKISLLILFVSLCLSTFSTSILLSHFYFIQAFCLFQLALNIQFHEIVSNNFFRRSSTIIFLTHMYVYFIVLNVTNTNFNSPLAIYYIVCVGLLIMSILINWKFSSNRFVNAIFR
ncbi:acyltransferase family protein [Sphingobacterium kyonggiense]